MPDNFDFTLFLDKSEQDLQQFVETTAAERLDSLFTEFWDAIRQAPLFAGQARNEASLQALLYSRVALAIANHSTNPNLQAEAHRMMAYVLNANELYDDAIVHYMQAIMLLESQEAFQKAARTRLGMIAALFMTGHYEEALSEGQRAHAWFVQAGDRDGEARLYVNLGNLHHRMDRHEEAVAFHEKALGIFRKLKNQAVLAPCFLNIADSLTILDRFEEANRYFENAEKFSRKLNQTGVYTQARYNRAYLSYLRGRYSEAIQSFDELREAYDKTGSRRHSALCDLDESEIYLHLNVTADALNLAGRAVETFKELKMGYEEAKARAFVGIALTHAQRYNEALQIFAESQQIFEKEKNRYFVGSVQLFRAQVLFAMGRFWEASSLAKAAQEGFTSLNIPSKRALALTLLARIGLETEDRSGAAERIAELEQLLRETPIPLHLFPCYSISAKVAEYGGDLDKARKFYELAAAEVEVQRAHLHYDKLRVSFFTTKNQVYEALLRLALGQHDPGKRLADAFNWCERARSRGLVELLSRNMAEVGPHSEQSLLNRINRLHEELNVYSRRAESDDGSGRSLWTPAELELKKNELSKTLKQLSRKNPELGSLHNVSAVSLEEIQAILPQDCAIIEYFGARDEILAFVVTPNGGVVRRHLCTRTRIQELNDQLRFQMDKVLLGEDYFRKYAGPLQESTVRCLHELYRELVEPLADVLTASHLIIVPHQVLHYLPFHAFFDGKQYLMDRFTISYAPSASVYRYCVERKPIENASALIVGVPDEKAPLIRDEVLQLKKRITGARCLFGRRASRKAVIREAAESNFLHIASHATFRGDNPMLSSLKLSDGPLTALDLYSMSCRTNLVSLSGCNSGMTDSAAADELLGLMRGFLYAGARSLLLSLWHIHDRSTLVFMEAFYDAWLSGSAKAQALRHAATKVRESEPHPYFWAPFILVGNI